MSRGSVRGFYMLMGGAPGDAPTPAPVIVGEYPDAELGVPYDHSLSIVGGKPPFTADVVEGELPDGLSLEIPAGLPRTIRLHGTPMGSMVIIGELPDATVGVPYSARLEVLNASGDVDIDIVDGAMPGWMSITWHASTQEIEFSGVPA